MERKIWKLIIKVVITPKNVFLLVKALYGVRKNAAKIFGFGLNPSFL